MKILIRNHLSAWLLGLLLYSGCAMDGHSESDPNGPMTQTSQIPTQTFAPNRVNIIPLTHFVKSEKAAELDFIRVYVELLDDFQSRIKSPGTFRFELYNRALRSVDPLGERIEIWKDIKLTNLDQNNDYWQEFLLRQVWR